jgi:hypothetical protein
VREPEAEEADVVAAARPPAPEIGDDVLHARAPDAQAVQLDHLGRGVERAQRARVPRQVPRPQARPAGELEHIAGGPKRSSAASTSAASANQRALSSGPPS